MNRLPTEKRAAVLGCLVESMSMAATTRITGVSKNAVAATLVEAGNVTSEYQSNALVNLPCKSIQVDEIWSFIYAKEKRVPYAKNPPRSAGDVWTWLAICDDTKLIPTWRVGDRSAETATPFMHDLKQRLRNRVQLTTDGHKPYLYAVEEAFGADVDYAMLVKHYGGEGGGKEAHRRYSPGQVNGVDKIVVQGSPDLDKISTSYAERHNLTLRMSSRRFTRLTNAFSRKLENHAHAVALHCMHYNFCRKHKSLGGKTPAMAAGIERWPWSLYDVAKLIEASYEARRPKKRGPYQKRGNSK